MCKIDQFLEKTPTIVGSLTKVPEKKYKTTKKETILTSFINSYIQTVTHRYSISVNKHNLDK